MGSRVIRDEVRVNKYVTQVRGYENREKGGLQEDWEAQWRKTSTVNTTEVKEVGLRPKTN